MIDISQTCTEETNPSWDRLNADWKWKVYQEEDYVARALPQLGGPVIRRFLAVC